MKHGWELYLKQYLKEKQAKKAKQKAKVKQIKPKVEAKQAEKKVEFKQSWQPNPSQVEKTAQDIVSKAYSSSGVYSFSSIKKKPEFDKHFLIRASKAATFLMDKDQVIIQLKKLNALLVKEAERLEILAKNKDGHNILAPCKIDEKYTPHRKVLRNVLERELGKVGFQPKLAKVNEFLNGGMFRETIRNGLLMKDSGLRYVNHGEFTHPIQWLMIAWQQSESDFLNRDFPKNITKPAEISTIDFFKSFGKETAIVENIPGKSVFNFTSVENGLWDCIVDELPNYDEKRTLINVPSEWENDPRGFCVPNNLHIFLFSNDIPELSFLKSLILSRELKRISETQAQGLMGKPFQGNKDKSYYSSTGLFSLKLPSELLEGKNNLRHLTLQVHEKDFEKITPRLVKSGETLDSKFNSKLRQARAYFRKNNYANCKDILLSINVYPDAVSLQNAYYKIGICFAGMNLIDSAELYMRKALYTTNEIEKSNDPFLKDLLSKNDLISKKKIITELGTYQFLLRAKQDAKIERQLKESPNSLAF